MSDMPKSGHMRHTGKYKGIAWAMDIADSKRDNSWNISFYAKHSTDFLFPRLVLIPLLRKEIALKGGFSAIGTSFCHNDTRYVIVGKPGAGKTRLLLDAVDAGANFVGDDEFMIDQKGEIAFLFDCIELRKGTVSKTIYWERLSRAQKIQLIKNNLISKLTGGKISFNIVVAPIQLGISNEKSKHYKRTVFVMLKQKSEEKRIDAKDILENNKLYETEHMSLFGEYLYGKSDLEKSHNAMGQFLSNCELWQMPSGVDAGKVLNL